MAKKPKTDIPAEDIPPVVQQLKEIRTAVVNLQVPFLDDDDLTYGSLERINLSLCRIIQRLEPRTK
jgi:hypothetical protein